ncbi:S15/NS1 RNA-binding domain-containing protein [Neolentinus lepideus HHB14362 ss-1]|uniref:S15/NS1 RNA-binding domain-containing protein n=1 Tax=Neolentinus lepideus HHB14362 ss-1 TaxID=1314782 RepID=A0A165QN04_9AGAM|nr:S15/NS1 RNA-binding domain-containing protein [Neolentinus lepideus HHB14362 ss-1]
MLRCYFAQSSRAVASSSKCVASGLHTSAVRKASEQRERSARASKKANLEKRAERERIAEANRPHVVLGTRPGEESKWANCDLAKLLITEEKLLSAPKAVAAPGAFGEVQLPPMFQFGVRETDTKVLFEQLPALSVEAVLYARERRRENKQQGKSHGVADPDHMKNDYDTEVAVETLKTEQLGRLMDLRNANAAGLAFENRKRVVEAFSEPSKPGDSGRPEVQAAILTMKIRNLWSHLTRYKRDVGNRRALRKLVHQRAKILKYLKRLDLDRYNAVLPRLALEPESVEGELVV